MSFYPQRKILVCGGREYCDWRNVDRTLKFFTSNLDNPVIIQGGAKGADFLAKAWAIYNEIDWQEYPANWTKHGKAAGPIRNQQMLDEGKPDLVIAFPGDTGTADMVKRAKEAGVRVVEIQ